MTKHRKKWHWLKSWKTVGGVKVNKPLCQSEGDLLYTRTRSQVDCYWCKQELNQPSSVRKVNGVVVEKFNRPEHRERVAPIHRPMMQPSLFPDKENGS